MISPDNLKTFQANNTKKKFLNCLTKRPIHTNRLNIDFLNVKCHFLKKQGSDSVFKNYAPLLLKEHV